MEAQDSGKWTAAHRQIFRFVFVWVGLLLATFPFPRPYLPDLGKILLPITTALAAAVARLLGLPQPYLHEVASDTTLMYVHMGLMLLLALIVSSIWGWRDRKAVAYPRMQYVLLVGMRYFLAAAMLSYGFAKVFKGQFYMPEPNTLYTPLGDVPRDLLFWSTMGVSRSYSMVTGLVEVLVGLLLLFQGSRLAGGLLGIAVMANVVLLNFSFDISVKIYSMLLLLLCVLIVAPDLPRLWALLRGRAVPALRLWRPAFGQRWRRLAFAGAKTLIVCALIFDAVGMNFEQANFNDDQAARPPLHGAYAVTTFVSNGDTLAPDLRQSQRWHRVFVHRQGYLIVQAMDDHMQDYALALRAEEHALQLLDAASGNWFSLQFEAGDDGLSQLHGIFKGDTLDVGLKSLPWQQLPVLRGEFHWTSDTM